jgi:23S rRNA (cytosine1962-C5)-methyltransferase
VKDGEVVDLVTTSGMFIARGTIEPSSQLRFRAWTWDFDEEVDEAFVARRFASALELRRALLPKSVEAFRVVHGENDRLPGLHCDIYGDLVSLRIDGRLGERWVDAYVSAAVSELQPAALIVREPQRDNGKPRILFGDVPDEMQFRERDRRFLMNPLTGQKTGFFLDQRDNRDKVTQLARGRRVLNLCSYTGGFTIAAGLGGADEVISVDISGAALEMAKKNVALNGLDERKFGFVKADVFDWLTDEVKRPPRFDLVIVDPPSFAASAKTAKDGGKAYVRLNELAMRATIPGGWFVSASCSSHLRAEGFLDLLAASAERSERSYRVVEVRGAGIDHPTLAAFPQGAYLKFVMGRLDGLRG